MLGSKMPGLRAFVCESRFQDIGTPADYLNTSLELARLESPVLSAREDGPTLAVGARSRVAPGAHVARTAIWDDVTIGEDVLLSDCVVGDGVSVPAGTRWTRRAIVPADCAEPRPGDAVIGDLLVAPL
jgi:NDP-sugar pyrophosphorylase family protein